MLSELLLYLEEELKLDFNENGELPLTNLKLLQLIQFAAEKRDADETEIREMLSNLGGDLF